MLSDTAERYATKLNNIARRCSMQLRIFCDDGKFGFAICEGDAYGNKVRVVSNDRHPTKEEAIEDGRSFIRMVSYTFIVYNTEDLMEPPNI